MKKLTKTLAAGIAALLLGFSAQAQQTVYSGFPTGMNACTVAAGTAGANSTMIGCGAGNSNGGNRNTVLGDHSFFSNTDLADNIAIGYQPLYTQTHTGTFSTYNIAIGNNALYTSSPTSSSTGINNNALGHNSLYSNTTGVQNTSFGNYSGYYNQTGSDNAIFGYQAGGYGAGATNSFSQCAFFGSGSGYKQTTALGVTAFGYNTLNGANTANYVTAMGWYALPSNTSGVYNTALGSQTLYSNTQGGYNTALGYSPLYNNVSGSYNSGVGHGALYQTTNSYNVGLGYYAGYTNTSGSENTFIGTSADASANNFTNGTALGYGAIVCASNTMMFGNSSVVGWGYGNACPTATEVFIVGTGTSNGNGAYLSAGGTWTNVSDRDKKENIKEVEGQDILKKINSLSISSWNYKGEPNAPKHIGPMAQDFYSIFAVGNDDKSISTIDPAGIALAGIKELSKKSFKIDSLIQKISQQDSINKALQNQINQIVNNCCNSSSRNNADAASIGTVNNIELIGNSAIIYQNAPNPFGDGTMVKYYIPENTTNAQVIFYDQFGSQLNTFTISATGAGQLNVASTNLAPGTYSYSLIINGKVIDTKKMIKTN